MRVRGGLLGPQTRENSLSPAAWGRETVFTSLMSGLYRNTRYVPGERRCSPAPVRKRALVLGLGGGQSVAGTADGHPERFLSGRCHAGHAGQTRQLAGLGDGPVRGAGCWQPGEVKPRRHSSLLAHSAYFLTHFVNKYTIACLMDPSPTVGGFRKDHLPLTDEVEAQRGEVSCSRSHSKVKTGHIAQKVRAIFGSAIQRFLVY